MLTETKPRHDEGSPVRRLRSEPQQHRSARRLAELEQAARTVIARVGRDAFTTQQIVDEADASIGTFYRYFADRVAVLDHVYPHRSEGLTDDTAIRIAAIDEAIDAVHVALLNRHLTVKHLSGIRNRLLDATS